MHIKGGLRGHRGNPLNKYDEGVFISKINSGGAAKRDGRMKVGIFVNRRFVGFEFDELAFRKGTIEKLIVRIPYRSLTSTIV